MSTGSDALSITVNGRTTALSLRAAEVLENVARSSGIGLSDLAKRLDVGSGVSHKSP